MEFINEEKISSILEDKIVKDSDYQREAIQKAKDAKGLTLQESAALLNIEAPIKI